MAERLFVTAALAAEVVVTRDRRGDIIDAVFTGECPRLADLLRAVEPLFGDSQEPRWIGDLRSCASDQS